jgi:hypothetical protein
MRKKRRKTKRERNREIAKELRSHTLALGAGRVWLESGWWNGTLTPDEMEQLRQLRQQDNGRLTRIELSYEETMLRHPIYTRQRKLPSEENHHGWSHNRTSRENPIAGEFTFPCYVDLEQIHPLVGFSEMEPLESGFRRYTNKK